MTITKITSSVASTSNGAGDLPKPNVFAQIWKRVQQIALTIFRFIASFFQKKSDAPPPQVTLLVPPKTNNLQELGIPPPPPQPPVHAPTAKKLSINQQNHLPPVHIIPSPHLSPINLNLNVRNPLSGEERITSELKNLRQSMRTISSQATEIISLKYLKECKSIRVIQSQLRTQIATALSVLQSLSMSISTTSMPTPFEGDIIVRTNELLLAEKDKLLVGKLQHQASGLNLNTSPLSPSNETDEDSDSDDDDVDDGNTIYDSCGEKTYKTGSQVFDPGASELKEVEELQSEISGLSDWLTEVVTKAIPRYQNSNANETEELKKGYITPIITWFVTKQEDTLTDFLAKTCTTSQPILVQEIIKTCYKELNNRQIKNASEAKHSQMQIQIQLLAKQLESLLKFSEEIEKLLPQFTASKTGMLVDYFSNQLSQKLLDADWKDRFDKIFVNGLLNTLSAHALAMQKPALDDPDFTYLNTFAQTTASTPFLKKLYDTAYQNTGPIAQKEAEYALHTAMAEQLLVLLLPKEKTTTVDNETVVLDAYDQLFEILYIKESLEPARKQLMALYGEIKQNFSDLSALAGDQLPPLEGLNALFRSTPTQPNILKQLHSLFDTTVKNPLKKEIKKQIDEVVRNQLIQVIEKSLAMVTDPVQLDQLFGEVILPIVNDTLLGSLVGQIFDMYIDEFTPTLVTIKFPQEGTEENIKTERGLLVTAILAKLASESGNQIAPCKFSDEKLIEVVNSVIDRYLAKIPDPTKGKPDYTQILTALKAPVKMAHDPIFNDLVPLLIYKIGGWSFKIDYALKAVSYVSSGWSTENIISEITGKLITEATKTIRQDHTYIVSEVTKSLQRLYPDQSSVKDMIDAPASPAQEAIVLETKRKEQIKITATLMHRIIVYPFSKQHSQYSPWYYTNGTIAYTITKLVTDNPNAIEMLIEKIYTSIFSRKVLNINLASKIWTEIFGETGT